MDDFREWLSDNLRYFMLGGGVLLILLVLIFGIRACAGGGNKGGNSTEQTTQVTSSEELVTPAVTQAAEDTAANENTENPLVIAKAEVKELIELYYQALGNKDVDAVKAIEIDLAPEDEAKITNTQDFIVGYQVGDVHTKNGLEDGTYVVYAEYQYLCRDIETPVPALSQFYVITDSDGTLKIHGGGSSDSSISSYIKKLQSDADVKELTSKVQSENEQAQAKDPSLAEFLASLGEDGGTASEEQPKQGTTYVTNDVSNVRSSAGGSDSEIVTVLDYGTEVQVLGFEGEWAQIEYEGSPAYIYESLLDKAE